MQDLWVKLLSEESNNPNSVSVRTIDTLKNMSKEEALNFKEVSKNIIQVRERLVIFRDADNRDLSPIINLVDCGLVVSDSSSTTVNIEIAEDKNFLSKSDSQKMVIIAKKTKGSKQNISIPIFSLTKAGRDLFRVVKNEAESDSHFIRIAKKIAETNKDFEISLNTVTGIDGDAIHYDENNLLSCAFNDLTHTPKSN